MPRVNAEILRWARETAGLDRAYSASRLGLSSAGLPAEDKLAALEDGKSEPSRTLLLKAAKLYRRPLLAFYLDNPPAQGFRGEDFRTLPEGYSRRDDALVDALVRDVRARQSMVRATLENEGEAARLDFVGSKNMRDGVASVVSSIRKTLQISSGEFRDQPTPDAAFAALRDRAEQAGIFVLLVGNLGSHHSAIDVQLFRGFALADPIAPFVVINDQDAHTAWSFTLLHELAHVWLGQTGVSGEIVEQASERFCNDVAGEYLLPMAELQGLNLPSLAQGRASTAALREEIGAFASARNLSSSMVAYRLFLARRLDRPTWDRLSVAFRDMWISMRDTRRALARERGGGPNYYVVRGHRVGHGLIRFVERMLRSGALSTSKAGIVLGVKGKQVRAVLESGSRPV